VSARVTRVDGDLHFSSHASAHHALSNSSNGTGLAQLVPDGVGTFNFSLDCRFRNGGILGGECIVVNK
jgi:hypothetical protein